MSLPQESDKCWTTWNRWLKDRVIAALLLWLEKHPEKTFIGRIERGFDFPGYHFSPKGLTAAKETLKRFVSRATRLYEQEPGEPYDSSRLGLYVERWLRAGLRDLTIFLIFRATARDIVNVGTRFSIADAKAGT
jgi:hypothetical protein